MSSLGKRVRSLRERQQKTISEVAQRIGVPASTYREWEYGRSIRGEFYLPLSKALSVSLYELVSGQPPRRAAALDELDEIARRIKTLRDELASILT